MPPKRKADNTDDDAPVNWSKLKVAELKAELEARGLPQAGVKKDLVARLEADDQGLPIDPVPAAAPKKKSKKAAVADAAADVSILGPLASEVVQFQDFNPETGEQRPRAFVPAPDEQYKTKYHKAHTERLFMLDRQRGLDRDGYPNETFDIAGSTGNIYQTTISRNPKCVCMDARIRGQKCKHINYALIIILKAPSYLCYQNAFLSHEIDSIFANAPVTRAPDAGHQDHAHDHVHDDEAHAGKRKPVEGDCPICVCEMETGEELVWCKAACGQNFHKACFDQWRASKRGARVTCVYCRTEWQEEGMNPSSQRPKPAPGSLASLKEHAPKKGSYKNIGHLPMYQTERGEN